MKTIVVVDDEVEICEFLKAFFEDRDYHVFTAHNGEQALETIKKTSPNVVLLDLHMPGMDGMKVLQKVKVEFPKLKVIMVTAIETQEKIEEAMRLGADNYITKPLSLEYLEKDVSEKIAQLAS